MDFVGCRATLVGHYAVGPIGLAEPIFCGRSGGKVSNSIRAAAWNTVSQPKIKNFFDGEPVHHVPLKKTRRKELVVGDSMPYVFVFRKKVIVDDHEGLCGWVSARERELVEAAPLACHDLAIRNISFIFDATYKVAAAYLFDVGRSRAVAAWVRRVAFAQLLARCSIELRTVQPLISRLVLSGVTPQSVSDGRGYGVKVMLRDDAKYSTDTPEAIGSFVHEHLRQYTYRIDDVVVVHHQAAGQELEGFLSRSTGANARDLHTLSSEFQESFRLTSDEISARKFVEYEIESLRFEGETNEPLIVLHGLSRLRVKLEPVLELFPEILLKIRVEEAFWQGQDGAYDLGLQRLNSFAAQIVGLHVVYPLVWLEWRHYRNYFAIQIQTTFAHIQEQVDIWTSCQVHLGSQHLLTQKAYSNIGFALLRCGYPREAVIYFKEVYKQRAASLGTDHVLTFRVINNIAGAVAESEGHLECLGYFRELVRASCVVLGSDHPIVLRARNNMYHAMAETELVRQAVLSYQDFHGDIVALGIEKSDLGLLVRHNLGFALLRSESFELAETVLESAVRDQIEVFGENTVRTQSTISLLQSCRARERLEGMARAVPALH